MRNLDIPSGPVILIEDDGDTEKLILRKLRQVGVTDVIVLRDGQEAIDWFRAATEASPLVFLDVKLPRVDGFSVLKQIRSIGRTSESRVVMFSSDGSVELATRALACGADDFAVKPVDNAELANTIRGIVARFCPAPASASV